MKSEKLTRNEVMHRVKKKTYHFLLFATGMVFFELVFFATVAFGCLLPELNSTSLFQLIEPFESQNI